MGFIRDYFGKIEGISSEDLKTFVEEKPQEDQHLEFKQANVSSEGLAKSVAGMLNANGGLIIVGIKEKRTDKNSPSYADEIEWVTGKVAMPERLESIVI